MTIRTYRCTLNLTITVDDEVVKASLLKTRLGDGIGGPVIDDPAATFDMQEQLLSSFGLWSPNDLMRQFLVNGYLVPVEVPITDRLRRDLPGAEVRFGEVGVVVGWPGQDG